MVRGRRYSENVEKCFAKTRFEGPSGPRFFFFFSPLSTINHLKSRAKRLEIFRKYGWPGGAEMSVLGGGLPYFGPPLNAV